MGELTTRGPETEKLLGIDSAVLRAVYPERDGIRIALLAFGDLDGAIAAIEGLGERALFESYIAIRDHTRVVFASYPESTRIELIQAPGDPTVLPAIPTK